MNWFLKMPSRLKYIIIWLAILICCINSCNEKENNGKKESHKKVVSQEEGTVLAGANSINIISPKGGETKDNIEEFEKLKKVISENLPNLERQFKKGSNVLVSNNAIN